MGVPVPIENRYVVALPRSNGTRLFCIDELRDQWSGKIYDAWKFMELHQAQQVADLHGAEPMTLREALMLEA